MAAHLDGSLVVYDKEKDDVPFVPENVDLLSPFPQTQPRSSSDLLDSVGNGAPNGAPSTNGATSSGASSTTNEQSNGAAKKNPISLEVLKSVQSANQKSNPVAFWKVGNSKINAFAFSPDAKYLAIVSDDGSLRVLDYYNEK